MWAWSCESKKCLRARSAYIRVDIFDWNDEHVKAEVNNEDLPNKQRQLTYADAKALLEQGFIGESAAQRISNHKAESPIAVMWQPNSGGQYTYVSIYDRPVSVPFEIGRALVRYDSKLQLLSCCRGYKPCQHSSIAKAHLKINGVINIDIEPNPADDELFKPKFFEEKVWKEKKIWRNHEKDWFPDDINFCIQAENDSER